MMNKVEAPDDGERSPVDEYVQSMVDGFIREHAGVAELLALDAQMARYYALAAEGAPDLPRRISAASSTNSAY